MKDKKGIGASIIQDIITCVDATSDVHADMINQTVLSISTGCNTIHAKSGNHKINTKSSMVAEVVGTSEYFLCNICLLVFLIDQGYGFLNKNFIKRTKVLSK